MEDKDSISYEFGPYRLLASERLLLRTGRSVPLAPKVFETLLVFLQNRGRLLTKDDLMRLIWGDTVVEEGNLTQNIFILRKLLGETPQDHRYLVTIPLGGYRFVAKVREISAAESSTNNGEPWPPHSGPASDTPLTTIAVLPFTVLNSTKEGDFEGVGMADTLITKLNSLEQIVVRPTTAVLRYVDLKEDLIKVGRELRVGTMIDGTIQHNGDRVRVNVQLVEVNTGETLWAAKYDDKCEDIFAVQDRIAEQLATALELELGHGGQRKLTRSPTENIEAYSLYIKGRYFWDMRTQHGLLKGIEYALKAIEIDPGNSMAHVGLADSYALLAEYLYLRPDDAFPKAKLAALRAIELDPRLAEAYASLAEVTFFYEWNWRGSEEQYEHAIAMKPRYASAYHWFAWFLMAMGRFDDALENIKQSQIIDPGSLTLNTVLGLPFYYQGYYEQAIAQFRATLDMESASVQARYYLGSALAQMGLYDEAAMEFLKVIPREYSQQASALLGHVYGLSGQEGKARRILKELQSLSKEKYVSPYLEALVYVGLGDRDEALTQLERAFQERAAWMVFLKVDPFLAKLRFEPRFSKLLKRLRLNLA